MMIGDYFDKYIKRFQEVSFRPAKDQSIKKGSRNYCCFPELLADIVISTCDSMRRDLLRCTSRTSFIKNIELSHMIEYDQLYVSVLYHVARSVTPTEIFQLDCINNAFMHVKHLEYLNYPGHRYEGTVAEFFVPAQQGLFVPDADAMEQIYPDQVANPVAFCIPFELTEMDYVLGDARLGLAEEISRITIENYEQHIRSGQLSGLSSFVPSGVMLTSEDVNRAFLLFLYPFSGMQHIDFVDRLMGMMETLRMRIIRDLPDEYSNILVPGKPMQIHQNSDVEEMFSAYR